MPAMRRPCMGCTQSGIRQVASGLSHGSALSLFQNRLTKGAWVQSFTDDERCANAVLPSGG